MNTNGQTRRGISLSLEQQEGHANRGPASPLRANGQPQRENHIQTRVISVEDLNTGKFVQSMGQNSRADYHITYGQAVNSSYHPPPPQKFMFGSQHTQSHFQPSQLPINSGNTQTYTVQTTQPLNYSIKRTHIPVHYINQIPIPVVASETKRYEVSEEEEEQDYNQADEQMLQQYEKLYGTYMEEKQRSQILERRLREYEFRDTQPQGSQVREVIKEVERPKKIDVKILASLLMKKQAGLIDQLVQRRKRGCLSKLRNFFSEQQSTFKTTIIRSSEQLTRVKTR